MRLAAGLLLLCALLAPRSAHADGALGPNGAPIRTSSYSVDLFQGPVLASSRVTALAGAYTAIAEGAEGIPFNPAAASLRLPQSSTKVDYDLTGGLTLPTSVQGTDFDNNGRSGFGKQQDFIFLTGGGYIQYGHAAIGVMVSWQNYTVGQSLSVPQPAESTVREFKTDQIAIRFFKVDPVVSYGFLDDQLHVGAGLRAALFQVHANLNGEEVLPDGTKKEATQTADLYTSSAVGVQGGILWMPYAFPLRLGAAVRSPLAAPKGTFGGGFSAQPNGDIRAGTDPATALYLPERADLPWEVEGGAAIQLWERPLNMKWQDEDEVPVPDTERWRQTSNGQIDPPYRGARRLLKKRYREIPRRKILLTTSTLLSGVVRDAVGIESMLTRTVERSGQSVSVTVRGGVEAEVIPWWLVLRAGSYLEPTRFRESSSRLHGTAGFQVRLFKWDAFGIADRDTIWRLSTAVDVARDYFAWSIGGGLFL